MSLCDDRDGEKMLIWDDIHRRRHTFSLLPLLSVNEKGLLSVDVCLCVFDPISAFLSAPSYNHDDDRHHDPDWDEGRDVRR